MGCLPHAQFDESSPGFDYENEDDDEDEDPGPMLNWTLPP
jgi:hypothetical protein